MKETRSPVRRTSHGLPLFRQVASFGFVSVATTFIDFALFNILIIGAIVPVVVANTISYSAGILASYLLNKRITFPGGGRDKRSHEVGIFVAISLSGLIVSNVAVGVAAAAGASTLVLNGVKLLAAAGIWSAKFLGFRRWVYPMPKASDEADV